MPSRSKAQHNLMAMVANNPKAAKRVGIKQSVGKEFMKADKGKRFAEGGVSSLLGASNPNPPTTVVNVAGNAEGTKLGMQPAAQNPVQTNQNFNPYQATTTMKKGGRVRGCGVAKRGLTKGRMV